jgi:hypothetical protein
MVRSNVIQLFASPFVSAIKVREKGKFIPVLSTEHQAMKAH